MKGGGNLFYNLYKKRPLAILGAHFNKNLENNWLRLHVLGLQFLFPSKVPRGFVLIYISSNKQVNKLRMVALNCFVCDK